MLSIENEKKCKKSIEKEHTNFLQYIQRQTAITTENSNIILAGQIRFCDTTHFSYFSEFEKCSS